MKKNFLAKMIFALLLGFWGLTNANAAILDNTETVNIVQISTWMTPNNTLWEGGKPYAADVEGSVVFSTDATADNTQWYEIPAGGNSFGAQLYYYKNVATGAYLQGSSKSLDEDGDWIVSAATTSATNDGSDLFKWEKMDSNWGNGPWLVNEAGNTGNKPANSPGNKPWFAFTSLTLNSEFFGVDLPNAAISSPNDGSNAWTAVEMIVAQTGVANPDFKTPFLQNVPRVNVIQISTWMTPNNTAWAGGKPYAADVDGSVVYSTDASADNTKWYEIPAGGSALGVQLFYYKNVATGAYLQGSSKSLSEDGDWIVSEATTSEDNDGSDLFKWEKMDSNWGNGPWLVNEAGNTGNKPAGSPDNKPWFAFTSLTLNSEFFGVDLPNAAISSPNDGSNAWTAVEIKVADTDVANPDYRLENPKTVDAVQISTWMDPHNALWEGGKPYAADVDGSVVYSTDASADNTKWLEIPAGAGKFGQQVYYYYNVATKAFLVGSSKSLDEDGDWIVSTATTSEDNDGSDLFKWEKMDSNWGNGPWLVNEAGNTGNKPANSPGNKPWFAFTSLTLNSEFFGVDLPNAAISTPNDGSNAWTAVEIKVADTNVPNPLYKGDIVQDEYLPIANDEDLGAGWNSSYDAATRTVTFDGTWVGRGWWFGNPSGHDLSDFKYVVVEFESMNAGKVKLQAEYNNGTASTEAYANTDTKRIVLELDEAGKADVMQLYLQNELAGTVVLKKAYLTVDDPRKPDLVVTDITWAPESPAPGDNVVFSATIKNIGDAPTPDVKHGVVFSVGTTTVGWSDTHLTGMAPGESVTLTANGGPNDSDGSWTAGRNPQYTVTALVNDQNDIDESNTDNNTLTKPLVINGLADLKVMSVDWTPSTATAGSNITFRVQVQNIGQVNVPAGVKVNFTIDGVVVAQGVTTVMIYAQSTDLIRVAASTTWVMTDSFKVTAEINPEDETGARFVEESDYTNNVMDGLHNYTGINPVSANDGNIYVNNGTLYLVNYPASSVGIYSLLGQKVASFDAVSDKVNVNLASGIYIVTVQFDGKIATQKVIVK